MRSSTEAKALNRVLLLLSLFTTCAACGEASTGPADSPDMRVVVRENDDGKQISLAAGKILTIELPAQLGTGYSWALTSEVGPQFEILDGGAIVQSGTPGGFDLQVFTFAARTAGTRELAFAYRRPWENTPAAKTFRVWATVTQR